MLPPDQKQAQAVALKYDGKGAPRVVAKGDGETARAIIELARQHGVPLNESPELVEILSRVALDTEVPRALYIAVAQILVFAYKLSGRTPPRDSER